MRILQSDLHEARMVDPFRQVPCAHDELWVHITDAESMGADVVECKTCGYTITLADLYAGMRPPTVP